MDKVRLLELENKFILLKRNNEPFEQIAKLLPSIDRKILKRWEKSYSDEVNRLKKENPTENRIIIDKNSNGKYNYHTLVKEEIINQLDDVRNQLSQPFQFEDKNESDKANSERLIHLETFNNDFKSIAIVWRYDSTTKQSNLEVQPTFVSNSPQILEKTQNALQFYFEYYLRGAMWVEEKKRLISRHASSICFEVFENTLPYAIKQLRILNFKDIKDILIENLEIDAKWIFLTGENSYGKTTVLQGIALALSSEWMDDFRPMKENFAIEYQATNESIIINYWNRSEAFKYMACYGASRLELQHDRSNNEVGEKSSLLYSLFHSDGVLLNIEIELYLWFIEKDSRFEEIVMLFKKLIPTIEDIVVERKDRKIYYIEKLSSNRLTNKQLGSGYKSLIAMVGDMMIRLFKTQPDITKPSDLAGIVLIDELDLHWHPKWQRRLPTLLSEIFPKVQFIASTHSEIPLLGAPENSIFLKVTRTLEEGVKVHKIDIDLSNLLPNHLLTSELFDMEFADITSVTHKPKQDLRTEDTMKEIKKTDDVEAYLKDYAANNAKFSDDLFD